jgi:TPR repeat protein
MCASAAEDLASLPDCHQVVARAKERLQMASYMPVRNVSCEYDDGVLILRGQVPTFFEKQLAQEAVAKLDGVHQVLNQVEVVERPSNGEGGNVGANYYRCALQCADPEEKRQWLKKAAYEGHVPAIYRYGLECGDSSERKRWLRQAAEAGDVEAMYTYFYNIIFAG